MVEMFPPAARRKGAVGLRVDSLPGKEGEVGGLGVDLSTQAPTLSARVLFPPGTWLQRLLSSEGACIQLSLEP